MVRDLGLGFGSQISAMVVFEGKVSGVAVVRGEGGECPKFDGGGRRATTCRRTKSRRVDRQTVGRRRR